MKQAPGRSGGHNRTRSTTEKDEEARDTVDAPLLSSRGNTDRRSYYKPDSEYVTAKN